MPITKAAASKAERRGDDDLPCRLMEKVSDEQCRR